MINKARTFQITGILLIVVAIFMALSVQAFAAPADASPSSATVDSPSSITAAQTDPEPVEPIEDEDDFDDEHDPFLIAADLIGIEVDALWEAIDNGQTIAEVATANNVDPQTIIDALIADERAFVDELVAEGEISAEEATEWLAEVDLYVAEFVNELVDFEEFEEGDDPFSAIVGLLGIDEDALWEAIENGQTLADIAQANGVAPEAVVALLVEQENAFIDELLAEGEITEEEATEWRSEVDSYMAEFVNELVEFEEGDFEDIEFADDYLALVVELLGMDEDAVWEALESGQTLAQLAEAQSVDLQALKDVLIASENELIDEMLVEGEISEEEATEWRSFLAEDVDFWVNESWETDCDDMDWDDAEFEDFDGEESE